MKATNAPTTGSQIERLTSELRGTPGASRRRCRRSRAAARVAEVAGSRDRSGRGRLVEIGDRPRPRQLDRDVGDDATGTRRQDDDPVGDRIASGMLWVTMHDRRRGAVPEPQQLEVEPLAAQRIERAERLVEQQDRGLERERPGERDPLARSRPTAPRAAMPATAGSRPTSSISVARRRSALRGAASPRARAGT